MGRLMRLSLAAALAGALALAPGGALAGSATQTFLLVAEAPNVGVAANGDTVNVTCTTGEQEHVCGSFSVHPKSIEASGEFEHFLADGTLFASGTWTATKLISYHSYGCGELFGDPLPAELCGGALRFGVVLSTPLGDLDGILTVFCIVGPKVPASHAQSSGEGVTLVVPGIVNFNHSAGGENIYIQI